MSRKEEKISLEEKEWRAERDAETLMEYQKIRADKKRIEEAKRKLKQRKEDITKALK